ncbi:hypothetical protein ABW19_dt0200041 [Dactylella cylindrospora]|nr:hypothetical protein ABW19_dt0200041 [Dactylella cylindrospora]
MIELEALLGNCSKCLCDQDTGELTVGKEVRIGRTRDGCVISHYPNICQIWLGCGCLANLSHPVRPNDGTDLRAYQEALDSIGWFTRAQNPEYRWHYDPSDASNFLKFTPINPNTSE